MKSNTHWQARLNQYIRQYNASQYAQEFWAAVMFYTRIPVPNTYQHSDNNLHQSRKYFPLIGVIIGSCAALTLWLCQLALPMSVSVALSMLATVLLTGAFHEDGLADSCDGFGGGWSQEQVLTIMKDSRVGTYATIGIISILGIKFLSLYELSQHSVLLTCLALINGHTLSRIASSFAIEQLDYVQDIDRSKIKPVTTTTLNRSQLCYSTAFGAPALLLLLLQQPLAILALLPLLIAFYLLCHYFQKRIGGYTGDCLGALQQVTEAVFYLALLAII